MQRSDHWNTPEEVLERVRKIAPIGLDPCSNTHSVVGAELAWTEADGGLTKSWEGRGLVYVNPPYSAGNLVRWAAAMTLEAQSGVEIVYLVPANLETKAWRCLWKANAICFPHKRIRFTLDGKPVGSPRFASAVGYFGQRKMRFFDAFKDYGKVVFP
jgi:hypothetical protein